MAFRRGNTGTGPMDFWTVFPVALALVFVIEGMMPFISPRRWRSMIATVAQLDDQSIRRFGLGSMVFGIFLLYLVN
ncbi:MAG: DUF2065 domain-containing protein [Pseudomonadota bacterium]